MASSDPLSRRLLAVIDGRTYRIETLADARLLIQRMGKRDDLTWLVAAAAIERAEGDPAQIPHATDAFENAIRTERWLPFQFDTEGAGVDEGQLTEGGVLSASELPHPGTAPQMPAGAVGEARRSQETTAATQRSTHEFKAEDVVTSSAEVGTPTLSINQPQQSSSQSMIPGAADLHVSSDLAAEAIVVPGPLALSHRELMARVALLEELVRDLRSRPCIGHNNPPAPIDAVQIGSSEIETIQHAIFVLKAQPIAPEDTTEAVQAASVLRTIGDGLWKALVAAGAYTAKQCDVFIAEFTKTAGAESAKWLIRVMAISATLSAVTIAAEHWLKLIH